MTHKYHYLSCATYFIQQEYPELNIEWRSPNNFGEGFETRYKEAVRKAEEAGHNVDKYKKIVEEGADYAGKEFAWETAGYFWKAGNANTVIDGLSPDKKEDADKVTDVVHPNASDEQRKERMNYYEETMAVIK